MPHGSAGSSVHRDNTTTTQTLDPMTQDWRRQALEGSTQAGQLGPSPLVTGAAGYGTGMQTAGNLGMSAMSGDANAVSQMMNPYQQQVIGGINRQWDRQGLLAENNVNSNATQNHAFGGSRNAVASGEAAAQNEMNRNSQVGGLLYGGFGDTMNRAGQMAQMGAQGAGMNAQLGMNGVGSPGQWRAEMATRYGRGNPYGGSTGATNTGWNSHANVGWGPGN